MNRLIVAIDRKRGLAKGGLQPWYIPEDERYFTEQTKKYGGHNLMGSRTFELSLLNKPFEGRETYVLTRQQQVIEGTHVVNDLHKLLKEFEDKDLWVIGGANVFDQVMQLGKADELYITHIEAEFGCNQFFPEYEPAFQLAEKSDLHEENGFIFYYAKYVRT